MKRRSIVRAACVLAVMLLAPWVYAQAPAEKPGASSRDKWEFTLTPYFWALEINSKVTVKGYSATQTTPFHTIWDNLNGAALVHAEAMKGGQWGFFVDVNYLKVRGDGEFQGVRNAGLPPPPTRDLTLTTEAWIVEFGGLYRLGTWPMEGKPGQAITVDALGGARYWYVGLDLDTTSPINPSGHDQWVDPFIGARINVDLTKKLSFNLRGDVGGFGVGSDFSWNGMANFGYRFTPTFTALLGYRALYVNYKKSSGSTRYQETFYGPGAGVTFVF